MVEEDELIDRSRSGGIHMVASTDSFLLSSLQLDLFSSFLRTTGNETSTGF